jgi:hypothetical protein
MTTQAPSKELAERLRRLDFGCRMPPSVIEEAADFLDGLTDEPGAFNFSSQTPPLPKHDHAFQDIDGDAPDILVWNEKSMRAYANAAVKAAASAPPPPDDHIAELRMHLKRMLGYIDELEVDIGQEIRGVAYYEARKALRASETKGAG